MMNKNDRLSKELDKEENSKEFKGRNRSRKPRSGGRGKDSMKSLSNDISWYSTDPSIIRDAASFPFSRRAGTNVGYYYAHNEAYINGPDDVLDYADSSAPGIYRLTVCPTIGYSTDRTSPINIAATSFYEFVRYANSGSKNYDTPDLMLYLLAMAQIYSIINWYERIYGTALMYSQRNAFIPRYLLLSDGIDMDDLASNLAQFRYGLNLAINKVSSLAVPNSLSLFNRMAFLFQNYYIEGPTIKDQIYYLSPQGFSKYQVNSISNKGELRFQALNRSHTSPIGTATLLTYLNDFINALLEQEDIGIMTGDILKVYGDNIIKLKSVDEYYPMDFVQDDVFLNQIKNSTPLIGTFTTITGMGDIGQDNQGNIVAKPYLNVTTSDVSYKNGVMDILKGVRPITFNKQDVTPEDVVEGTRLHASIRTITDGGVARDYIMTGTEIPLVATMFRVNRKSTLNAKLQGAVLPYTYLINMNDSSQVVEAFNAFSASSYFKYHNAAFPIWTATAGSTWNGVQPYFDLDNYTLLTGDEIERIHEACVINMVHVPAVAKAYQG